MTRSGIRFFVMAAVALGLAACSNMSVGVGVGGSSGNVGGGISASIPLGKSDTQEGNAVQSSVTMFSVVGEDAMGPSVGTLQLSDTKDGLGIAVALSGLQPGEALMALTNSALCPAGNPTASNPLPSLTVDSSGQANGVLVAKGLSLAEVKGRAIVVRSGGMTLACGVAG